MAVDVLVATEDVADKVRAAKTPTMSDADANVAMKAKMGELEKACTDKNQSATHEEGVSARCEVVTLYGGGKYHLYSRTRVTPTFASCSRPTEAAIAFSAATRDNFTYPRFDLDMALFRCRTRAVTRSRRNVNFEVERAKVRKTAGSRSSASAAIPVRREALPTLSQIEQLRDTTYPRVLDMLKRDRDLLKELSSQGHEYEREAREGIFDVENSIKALTGYLGGLRDPALMKIKKDDEASLQKAIDADPKLKAQFGTTLADVAKVQAQILSRVHDARAHRRLVAFEFFAEPRAHERRDRAAERAAAPRVPRRKPRRDQARAFFGGARVRRDRSRRDSRVARARAAQAHDQPDLVSKILNGKTPAVRAREIVVGSKLFDVYARRALDHGGKAALGASDDPAIVLVRTIDEASRAARKKYEDAIEAPRRQLGEKVAQATFAARGTSRYPDATFTLRLSVGVAKGYTENGKRFRTRPTSTACSSTRPEKIRSSFRNAGSTNNENHADNASQLRIDRRHHRRQQRKPRRERAGEARRVDLRRKHFEPAEQFRLPRSHRARRERERRAILEALRRSTTPARSRAKAPIVLRA